MICSDFSAGSCLRRMLYLYVQSLTDHEDNDDDDDGDDADDDELVLLFHMMNLH